MLVESYSRFMNELKYTFIILVTFILLLSATIIFTYIVLYAVKYYALLLPDHEKVEVILKVDYYISKLDEFFHSFKM